MKHFIYVVFIQISYFNPYILASKFLLRNFVGLLTFIHFKSPGIKFSIFLHTTTLVLV